jgi:hypothetical protein
MKIILKFTLFICLVSLFGCSNEWKDGQYVIKDSPEDPSQKTLYLEFPAGNAQAKVKNIKMIGKSNTHIIAQTTNNQYWIVEKSNESVMGPMSLDEFKLISYKMRQDDIDMKEI